MTSIRNTRGYIERPGLGSACWERILSEIRRSANADSAELESTCSWTATASKHGPGVDGGPVRQDASDDHDCQSAPTEPSMATGILGAQTWSDDEQGCDVEQDRAQGHREEVPNDLG
jgi:hypothetical protein